VFLVSDARRAGAPDLERYFRDRATGAGLVTGVLAAAGLLALRADARTIFDKLVSDGLPLVLLSLACGIALLVMLRRGARRGTRVLAAGAVVAVIWGWAVAQHPYILPPSLTVSAAAAPDATLKGLLAVFGIALLVVIPSFGLLFTLVQRSIVEETAAPGAVDVK
jgi:cytochrome d ubiquinol oxidase subunit II